MERSPKLGSLQRHQECRLLGRREVGVVGEVVVAVEVVVEFGCSNHPGILARNLVHMLPDNDLQH